MSENNITFRNNGFSYEEQVKFTDRLYGVKRLTNTGFSNEYDTRVEMLEENLRLYLRENGLCDDIKDILSDLEKVKEEIIVLCANISTTHLINKIFKVVK